MDLVFLRKDRSGAVTLVELGEVDQGHLTEFHGAGSGLLDPEDLEEAASVLEPGTTAAVLVYENVWAAPLAAALRRSGAELVAGGRVPADAVLATLDAR